MQGEQRYLLRIPVVATIIQPVLSNLSPMGKKPKPVKTVLLKLRITPELKDKLEADAAERGITVSELVRRRMSRKKYVRKSGEESTERDRDR